MGDSFLLSLFPAGQLQKRFDVDKDVVAAAEMMKKRIFDANHKWTTILYDGIQKLQNNIHSETWQ